MTLTQALMHLVVVIQHLLTLLAVGQYGLQFTTNVIDAERLGHQFLHHFAVSNQIHQRHVFHTEHVAFQKTDELRQWRLVAHHLRHAEHTCLEGCRAASYQCGCGLCQQGERRVRNETHTAAHQELLVILVLYRRSSGQHQVVLIRKVPRGFHHRWQVIFNLLFSRPRQQCNNRLLTSSVFLLPSSIQKFPHLVRCRIAYIMDGIVVLPFEELHLERQYREQLVHVALDVLDAILLPRPNLRRDIVVHFRRWLRAEG